jgi:hypothetical protein
VGNVVGRPDRRGNLYPAKQRPERKIDAAVALMMAVGRAMAEDTNEATSRTSCVIPSSPDRPGHRRSGGPAVPRFRAPVRTNAFSRSNLLRTTAFPTGHQSVARFV